MTSWECHEILKLAIGMELSLRHVKRKHTTKGNQVVSSLPLSSYVLRKLFLFRIESAFSTIRRRVRVLFCGIPGKKFKPNILEIERE
ncbi:hypothetical protein RUM44_006982 [Polyplax serrata]|uniref:Transposase n=1 Tax=Polyplax serrata TaxID=468196 RepID=A0ABR1B052_POLSC